MAGREVSLQKTPERAEPRTWSSTHSHWDEHPDFPLEDWHREIENDDTRQGYGAWVDSQIELHRDTEEWEAECEELDAPKRSFSSIGISSRSEFYAIATTTQIKRAEELALQSGGYSWVLWTPSDPESDVMFVGDSPENVRAQFNAAMADK